MKLTCIPSKDELILKIYPVKGKPNKKLGPFNLWWEKMEIFVPLQLETIELS
jgi:hypothetical protein